MTKARKRLTATLVVRSGAPFPVTISFLRLLLVFGPPIVPGRLVTILETPTGEMWQAILRIVSAVLRVRARVLQEWRRWYSHATQTCVGMKSKTSSSALAIKSTNQAGNTTPTATVPFTDSDASTRRKRWN